MVLFQPAAATVWDFGYYFGLGEPFEIIFWIVAIIGAIFALFLLSSYLNTRKREHFYWGMSFALLFIVTHLSVNATSFAKFLEPVPAALSALMVGLFAVGLYKNVYPEKKMGKYLLYYVLIMSVAIMIFKIPAIGTPAAFPLAPVQLVPSWVAPILVMALHIPSAILIVFLPLRTRDESGKSALVMSIAGVLMGLVGVLLALATMVGLFLPLFTEDLFLEIIFTAFPFIYLGAGICFAWGTFIPKKWNFTIPGIELE
ncbi:MAG: hypothetical protein ACFFDN_19000 [Candidatus Hodarchaeota archaeon]